MPHSLVLNASHEPLCVVPVRRALILVLNEKATCLEDSGVVLRSATLSVPSPSVIRLSRFVRVPFRGQVPLTRRALFARDGGRCVYCGAAATSVDHVVPRSRGGAHSWDNVVSACRRCNHVKGDRFVADLGWPMARKPAPPSGLAWRIIGTGLRDPRWEPYLAPFGSGEYTLARLDGHSVSTRASSASRAGRTADRAPGVRRGRTRTGGRPGPAPLLADEPVAVPTPGTAHDPLPAAVPTPVVGAVPAPGSAVPDGRPSPPPAPAERTAGTR